MLGRVIGSSIRRDHTSRRLVAKARLRGLLLLLALALGALTLAVLPGGGPAGGKGIGRAKYRLDAAKYFAPFSTSQYAPWVTAHITLIKGYPPFSDRYLGMFGLPLIGYHDPATEGQAPLAPAQIEEYVAKVRRDVGVGYTGVFVDDANWSAAFRPSPGPPAALANLIEAIHAAEPGAMIEMNSQYHDIWPLMKAHDPNVERALRFVNVMTKEFGVGPTAGISTAQDYGELFQFVDALHAKGIHVTMTGDHNSNSVPTMEYNLATYFLLNDGGDYINGVHETPEHSWPGFDVSLGEALGPRESRGQGLWRRRFASGVVYAVAPEGATQTIQLAKTIHSAEWGTVGSVTLAAGQGAVFVE
jgi:putative glycosyl hydrolase-like family 15 (GHL15) protein